ncbi:hypothetical protein BGP_2640 [Beggiatoa sp. PS]|nr:hypothetical protein BGP_2640 [Beggiatoa sp. PS]
MPRTSEHEKVFLQVGFDSGETEGNLRTIEIIGIPGEKLSNGECVVSAKAQCFFDDLVAKPLFRESRHLRDCNFKSLKIWLYHPDVNSERGYDVPQIDNRDLEISSNVSASKLRRIYVLDNGLKDTEYQLWQRMTSKLFLPLFRKFVAPPEPPEASGLIGAFFDLVDSTMNTVDKYAQMKQSLFFNTLIIQID